MKRSLLLLTLGAITLASCKKEDDDVATPAQQTDPTAVRIDSITLTGFNAQNSSGSYWDGGSGSNPADPFVKVYKDDVLLFTSTVTASASHTGSYDMSTADFGALPISYGPGSALKIKLYDDDGDPNNNAPDLIGEVVLSNALTFLYAGDHASGFSDQLVTGSGGSTFLLAGTFVY